MSGTRALLLIVGLVILVAGLLWTVDQWQGAVEAAPRFASSEPATITVTGWGEVEAPPDIATFGLGVSSTGENTLKAVENNNEIMAAVRAALREAGIAEEDMITNYFFIQYETIDNRGGGGGGGSIQIPRVYNMLGVTTHEIDRVGEFFEVAVAAGANEVSSLRFTIEDDTALRDQAHLLAVADAQEQAEKLAEALGMTVGPPTHVGPLGDYSYGGGGGGGPQISPGLQSVQEWQTITFLLE